MNINALVRVGLGLLSGDDGLIDWREAAGVAIDLNGGIETEKTIDPETVDEFFQYAKKAAPVVAELTGLEPAYPIYSPVLFDRSEWIVTISKTIKPVLEQFIVKAGGEQPFYKRRFLKAVVSGELGFVLGYAAKRVLGQYDISLLDPSDHDGHLIIIYPNVVEVERKLSVDKSDFRLWLVLHELTHAFEFQANPWLKEYIAELIDEQIRYAGRKDLANTPGTIMGMASIEENPALARAQALMSVLEGYSEFIMDKAAGVFGENKRIASLFAQARQSKNPIQKLIERMLGFQIKMDQYGLGYRFLAEISGSDQGHLIKELWNGPESMPTLTEIRNPELWAARIRSA